ncbi:MAG: tripartite tricarboxylate transporter substrate binding protein [Betaproteobacteria bacterium]|nr:tripartite tricarboxylate transporter substrate binding protein [Betaproteobacteria bacterium]
MAVLLSLAVFQPGTQAADWSPERNVEIIVTTGPGGAQDRTARVMQTIIQNRQLLSVPTTVINKPGGGGGIGLAYLNQHAGNSHYMLTTSPTLLTNHIVGVNKPTHTDVVPVAQLFSEFVGFAIRSDSPVKDARELLERLKQDPAAHSAAIATSAGNHNHIAIGMLMKAAGIDLKRLKVVVFKASGEAVTATLGGHVDFIATTASNLVRLAKGGKMRVVAVAAPARLAGPLAGVPTWRELGADAIGNNWRGVAAPRGTPADQVRFWEAALEKLVATEEWKREIEKNLWVENFMRSGPSADEYKRQYDELKVVLTGLGLAK